MGIACFQFSIATLVQQQSRLNRELMGVTDMQEVLTGRMNVITSTSQDSWYKNPEYKSLEILNNKLDNEKKTFETQLKDLEERISAFEKQRDKNLKDGIPQLG